jgi:hypothetical protein
LGHTFGDARPNHVPHSGPPKVMEELAFQSYRLAGCTPRGAKILDGLPCTIKNRWAMGMVQIPFSFQVDQRVKQLPIKIDEAPIIVLRRSWIESHRSRVEIDAIHVNARTSSLRQPV